MSLALSTLRETCATPAQAKNGPYGTATKAADTGGQIVLIVFVTVTISLAEQLRRDAARA